MKTLSLPVFALLSTIFSSRATAQPVYRNATDKVCCTEATILVRSEWGSLTDAERLEYLHSVQCLMKRPSHIPSDIAPAALSRYDDFTATHINATLRIHANGPFLLWHRHFLHLFESALREECGFQGTIPYFNWALWADDLLASPLFDGSATSFGGNGKFDPSNPNQRNGNYTPPEGQGGGCITTGPFANVTVPFRNFSAPVRPNGGWDPNGGIAPADGLIYAPHCLRRNINPAVFQNSSNQTSIDILLAEPDIVAFQRRLDSPFWPEGINIPNYGIHAGGHAGMGGDVQDLFASPADPMFFLHHGMVEHIYTQWQAADPASRQYALNGTDLLFNDPAGTEVSLDFVQEFGYLGEPRRLGDLMDVTKGPYCNRFDTAV